MLKKLTIAIIYIFLMAFNANAGSDGELVLNKGEPKEIKDCFEKLNRATFALNQGLDKALINQSQKVIENCPLQFKKAQKMQSQIYLI
jgi:phospholipid-binding lipoprotein MlaA